jgi:hypothetical protein
MFTFGSQVNPSLLRQDFSPILQAAQAQAQATQQAAAIKAQSLAQFGSIAAKGIENYQKNKEEEKQATATIKTSETLIKGLQALADQKDDKGNSVLPANISAALGELSAAISDPNLGVRERSRIANQGIQQFSGLINAGMSGAQAQASMRRDAAQTGLITAQANSLADQLKREKADNTAIATALGELTDQKLSTEKIVSNFIRNGGSIEGLKNLKGVLPQPKAGGTLKTYETTENDIPYKITVEEYPDGSRKELGRVRTDLQPGMRPAAGGGQEPIPGSEIDVKRKAATEATTKLYDAGLQQGTQVLEAISRAKNIVKNGFPVQGFGSTMFGWTPIAEDLDAQYNQIRGINVLDTIRQARAESPTGGSPFGQMNMKEFDAAGAVKGAVNRNMSDQSVLTNMDTIAKGIFTAYPQLKDQYKSILEGANVRPAPRLKVGRFSGDIVSP